MTHKLQANSLFILFLLVTFLESCSHQKSFYHEEGEQDALIYNLMGTKLAFLKKQAFQQEEIAEYEKQVQIETILNLPEENYKIWLEQTAQHFEKRSKPDSLYRYIGRDLFFKASILEKYGYLEKAEGLFSLLFQHFDMTEESLVHYAVLVLKLGHLEKARLCLLKAINLTNDSERKVDLIQVWLNIAEATGKKEIFLTDADQAMHISHGHYSVCSRYGKFLHDKNQTEDALKLLNNCLQKQNTTLGQQIISLELAKIYIQKMNFTKAESLLSKFESEKNIEADVALLLGLLHEQQGRTQRQVRIYEHYMATGGVDNRILERLSDYYFQHNSYDKGSVALKILSDQFPNNMNYKYRLAVANIQMGKFQQAINVLMELKKMGANENQIALHLYNAYSGLQQYDKALTHLRVFNADEIIQLEALALVGDYFTEKVRSVTTQELNNIITQWKEYLIGFKKVENTVEWKLQFAMTLEVENKVAEAIDVLENARSSLVLQEFQLYYLASLYERLKKYETTDKILSEILQKNPLFAHAWNFLGYSQLERTKGDMDLAKNCIQKAVALDPKSPHFRDSLGWYYYKTGEWSKALKELQIAYTLDHKDITIVKHLVQVLVVMKQLDQAKEMIKRVSQNFPLEDFSDLENQINLDRAPASE